jgi:hypothetical protein
VALVRTDVSEERIASIIKMDRLSDLEITLAVTNKQYVPSKRQFLQESHGVGFQKTVFFIVSVVETSNLTSKEFTLPQGY